MRVQNGASSPTRRLTFVGTLRIVIEVKPGGLFVGFVNLTFATVKPGKGVDAPPIVNRSPGPSDGVLKAPNLFISTYVPPPTSTCNVVALKAPAAATSVRRP